MLKIILVGYMGVGKSTIAKKLSKKMAIEAVDLDDLIEKHEKLSVTEIFKRKGEIYFRKIEHEILESLIENSDDFVLSLGGGTPCYANNHLLIKGENLVSIYLKASVSELLGRLKSGKKNRPLLENVSEETLEEFISKHLFDRNFYYHQSNHVVSVDQKTAEEIVEEIINLL